MTWPEAIMNIGVAWAVAFAIWAMFRDGDK